MKKIVLLLSIIVMCIFTLSCVNDIQPDYNNDTQSKVSNRSAQNKGGFDLKPFIDVSDPKINGFDITESDFEFLVSGIYRNKGGSSINFSKDNIVRINIPNTVVDGKEYSNIFIEYEWKIQAASKNLVYLCPVSKASLKVSSNAQSIDVDKFFPFISMYGFGEGRIEVSKHLDNISALPKGTYWKK